MPNLTRTFTVDELEAIGVPFYGPTTLDSVSPEDSEVLAEVLEVSDHGTSLNRRIFRHDGTCWQVYYRDHHDYGVTWDQEPVIATAVEERQVTVTRWEPVQADAT